jgi:hypothetical protein
MHDEGNKTTRLDTGRHYFVTIYLRAVLFLLMYRKENNRNKQKRS